ncbi:hypothetical protein UR09_01615 [Candidatus Nitromaritima sp. SCGC AAA799-A02]|nr:hypothetical protein UR09_01615 [Candidatus Nitromaritima sp. SCGC AAA799-A02]
MPEKPLGPKRDRDTLKVQTFPETGFPDMVGGGCGSFFEISAGLIAVENPCRLSSGNFLD